MVKNPSANAGDLGSIPESGRPLEKGMATHSSILAWETPWTEEPGGPWGCKESDMTEHTHTIHFLMWVRVKAMALAELPPSSKNRLISIRQVLGSDSSNP